MRDTKALHPELQQKIIELKKRCEKAGLPIKITECLRTREEQDALYAQGRTAPGNKVTNAKGSSYSSMHQWGVAVDFCRNVKGKEFDNNDKFFNKVGEIGKSLGLEWGGDWKSPVDMPHFQLPQWGSTAKNLKAKYGTPEKFIATWKQPTVKNPYPQPTTTVKQGQKDDYVKWLQWELNQSEKCGLVVDGSFGNATLKAVKAFQKKYKLEVDGKVGKITRTKLIELK